MATDTTQAAPAENLLLRALSFLDGAFVRWIVIAAYSYFFLIILAEVVMRHVLSFSTAWGEMTARYAFVYFAYIAAAEAFRHDEHIRIDFVPGFLGPKGRMILESYIDLLCILVSGCVIWYSLQVMDIQLMAKIRMHALPLNMAFAEAALPLGWALMVIRILQRTRRRLSGPGTEPKSKEVRDA